MDLSDPDIDYDFLCWKLWNTNTHLREIEGYFDAGNSLGSLLTRNQTMYDMCRASVLTFIAIRRFRVRECGVLAQVPKEVVREIAQYLWSTHFEFCWTSDTVSNPTAKRQEEFEARDAGMKQKEKEKKKRKKEKKKTKKKKKKKKKKKFGAKKKSIMLKARDFRDLI
jgi:hypothetical protein